jgi:hypothetical protein
MTTNTKGDILIRSEEAARLGQTWTWEDHQRLTSQLEQARHEREHWRRCWKQALLEVERLQKAETARRVAPEG